MGKNNFLQTTVVMGIGLFAVNNPTTPPRIFVHNPISVESKILKIGDNYNSTRINISNRFSLDRLKMNKMRLQSFAKLDENWNGYSAMVIDKETIDKVEKIISSLDFQPSIFPTGRGSIQIEKFIDDNNLVEIEISRDEIFSYSIINGIENEGNITEQEINKLITSLHG
jgi:hypothetical protein